MRVVVVMPTYNEAESLGLVAARLRRAVPEAQLLVVDDSSPDGTGELAEELAQDDPAVAVLHRPGKGGLGAAYRAGMAWALERHYDVIVEMDADGSHRPEDLPRLLAALDDADVVIGSRWVPGGSVVNWPLRRQRISRIGSAYARLALGLRVRDVTGGFRAYRRRALRLVGVAELRSQGYCFQIDVLRRAVASGARVAEVPIAFVEREQGVSKMTPGIVVEAVVRVTWWGVARRLARRHRRTPRRGA